MSGSLKLGLTIILAVVVIGVAFKLLAIVWGAIGYLFWQVLVPIAVLAAIGYAVYSILRRKSLGGGRRYLP